jgi:hypothetical protein
MVRVVHLYAVDGFYHIPGFKPRFARRINRFAILRSPRRRRRAVADMRKRAGRTAAGLLARLQREQVNLAMIASRVAADDPALVVQRDYCRSLRDALSAMPGAARAGSDTSTG